jgi:DNA helicase MCM9
MPRSEDIGLFQEVQGTVIRAGITKMLEWERTMECSSCKQRFTVFADLEQRNAFPRITVCPSQRDKPCNSKGFKVVEGMETRCRDYQEIKIQEHVGQLGVGSIPRSLIVVLMDDLVDTCKAGDEVTIGGIVRRRWRPMMDNERTDVELFLEGNCIRVQNEQKFGVSLTDDLVANFKQFWAKYKEQPLVGMLCVV